MIPGRPTAYLLCATPRSGSTLLCEMLGASGVAGRPNSFFRAEDLRDWADAWGLPRTDDLESPEFDRAYLPAMLREGRAGTGVFGLRIMWSSMVEASRRLNRALGSGRDIALQFREAFGPTLFIHLSRRDKVAQAVSRLRAEQSGLWHKAPDGRVLEGSATPRPVHYDPVRLAELVAELEQDDAAWTGFFAARGIDPLTLTYEELGMNPRNAVESILAALGLDPRAAERTPIGTAKLADRTSALWIERFRQERSASRT